MSAYIVSNLHIDTLIDYACRNRVSYYWEGKSRRIMNISDEQRCASVLHAENVRSVNARYEEHQPAHGYRYIRPTGRDSMRTAIEVIKACHGYEYQACETGDWEQSEACAIVAAITKSAIRALPGYARADTWHICKSAAKGA